MKPHPQFIKIHRLLKYLIQHPAFVAKIPQLVRQHGFAVIYYKFLLWLKRGTTHISFEVPVYHYQQPRKTLKTLWQLLRLKQKPLISIIMPVYNVDPKWLKLAIASVEKQWYKNWELCIVDDASSNRATTAYLKTCRHPKVHVHFHSRNQNIVATSNMALKQCRGSYIALLDHDDELTPDALFEVVKIINHRRDADFIYSDEDKISPEGNFSQPHFKPDYAPDQLLSQNYISHLAVIKKSLIDKVGGFTAGSDGAQDYDLYLKVLPHCTGVYHINKVLYHWRQVPGSTASRFDNKSYAHLAGKKAIEQHLQKQQLQAHVSDGRFPGTYRVQYVLDTPLPLVSIIVPFKDKPELLQKCFHAILKRSQYPNYELIGISNNSEQRETFELMQTLSGADKRVSFHQYNIPFNYSKINNTAVRQYARGEYIVLLNNDVEIITEQWIENLLCHARRKHIGAVGGKLYYPDQTIQHAGVILGINLVAGHAHKRFPHDQPGYFSRLHLIHNVSAVTAACLMVAKDKFLQVGGLDEDNLAIAFNDIDFCLKLRQQGYLNIFTPYCQAWHHESASRGLETTPEKMKRFHQEIHFMLKKYAALLKRDPFYNTNLTLRFEDFTLKRDYEDKLLAADVWQELQG